MPAHLATLGLLLAAATACGEPPTRGRFEAAERRAAEGETSSTLRMIYPSVAWKTVLDDVAEASGLQLVMGDTPSGRFEHYARSPVEAAAALRIVNDALYPKGYRVMRKGEFLIVLKDDQFRPTYPRYHYSAAAGAEAAARGTPPAVLRDPTGRPLTATPNIVRTAGVEAGASVRPAHAVDPLFPVAEPKRAATVVEPRVRSSVGLARDVYAAYGAAAAMVESGQDGLPAFRITLVGGEDRPGAEVRLAIDAQSDRLLVEAPPRLTTELVQLFNTLDAPPSGEDTRLVAAAPRVHQAATALPTVISQVVAMQAAEGDPPPAQSEAAPPAAPAEDISAIVDRLRSDVSVESLDELGLLVLRGNEADVQAVLQIIETIEDLSVGTTPEVHLRLLDQVDSAAMADLLNSIYDAVQAIETRPGRGDKRVTAVPVERPNAVLIVAPSVDLPSVLDLIDRLDTRADAALELAVFRLEYASAANAAELVEEFYAERGGLGTRARVAADPRTNTLIVQAKPNDLREVRRLVDNLDKADSAAVSRMAVIALRNALAQELADLLNAAIEDALEDRSAGPQVGQGGQTGRPIVVELLGPDGEELIRSGVLGDVRVTADPRTNSLVVIAPAQSLPLLRQLVERLDKPSAAAAEIKVFTLENADASAAVTLLGDLFSDPDADSPAGLQLAGTTDSASNLLSVRFSVDVRTNSILAVGGPDALTVVEAILLRLDAGEGRTRDTRVIKLKNAPAADVAEAINEFLETQRDLAAANPDITSTVELIEREVIVVPEPISNNLLVSATPQYFEEILRIAAELDAEPPQVIIQALLCEVVLENADEFGVELGFQDSVLFDRSTVAQDTVTTVTNTLFNAVGQPVGTTQSVLSQSGSPGFRFGDLQSFPTLPNNVAGASSPGDIGSQGLSNFGVGRVSNELGFGGLVLSASSESVSILIRALEQRRDVHILSRPQIRTVDGQLGEVQVGQSVPIITGVTASTIGLTTPQIEYDDAGIILSVTPRISPDGQVVMEVIAERSEYDFNNGIPLFVDPTTGGTFTSPVKNVTVARSTVSVANGQTAVLGGMITENDDRTERKVPWLGDLPIIGRAFRYDSYSNRRTELLMFLTPRVVANDRDNEVIKEVEAGRLHFFRDEAEAVHGPLFGVPEDEVPPPAALIEPYRLRSDAACEPTEGGEPFTRFGDDPVDLGRPRVVPADAMPIDAMPIDVTPYGPDVRPPLPGTPLGPIEDLSRPPADTSAPPLLP